MYLICESAASILVLLKFVVSQIVMGKKVSSDLAGFLKRFPENVQETTLWLRNFVWDLYPDSNELIYDNYNALAIGFALTDTAGSAFCSIAVYSKYVNFGFLRGTEISDPEKKLTGGGSLYRYLRVTETKDFPKAYMKKLLREARTNALTRLKGDKQTLKGTILTKAVSEKKRRIK